MLSTLVLAQPPAACRFANVVESPGDRPSRLIESSRHQPDFSHLLFPGRARDLTVWLRVDRDGRVTNVCLLEAPDGFRDRLIEAAKQLRYDPARDTGQPVATIVAATYHLEGRFDGRGIIQDLGTSEDVTSLERIAGSAEAARNLWQSQRRRPGQPKDLRVVAYARLGELATDESLAAQKRVEMAARGRSLVPASVTLDEPWPHPGWHMTDCIPTPVASINADGSRLVLLVSDLYGAWQLFLFRCNVGSRRCDRPKPVGPWNLRYVGFEASLDAIAPGRLRLSVVPRALTEPAIMDGTAPPPDQRRTSLPSTETREIVIAEVDRDTDGDGWTDLEERMLGLDPARADTDGDGADDAHDGAPDYAPRASNAEHQEILGAALFAIFGITESAWPLFARDRKVPQLQPWGLSAPVIFNRPLKDPRTQRGGVFVTWQILRTNDEQAIVEMTDWEGMLAAGGQEVYLRRIAGSWVVIGRQTTWIS
ncbi:MAG TPA: hypothetical protein VFK20_15410 [Vicinamibacterales bacterium]|nr:hypothetical protein [Vicinamibacterales bacterium]